MKKLIILLNLIFFNSNVFALEVETLGQESCWIENKGNGQYKVANFNSRKAFELDSYTYSSIEKSVVEYFSETDLGRFSRVDGFFQCSAFGSFVLLNLNYDNVALCAWAKVDNGSAQVISIGLSEQSGKCHGIVPGEIFLNVTDSALAKRDLLSSSIADKISEIEVMGSRYLLLKLETDFKLNAKDIVSEIESKQSYQWYKSSDYNYYNHPVGEIVPLDFSPSLLDN